MKKVIKLENSRYEVLLSKKALKSKIKKLAIKIKKDFKNDPYPIILVVVLKGAMYFGVDLSRELHNIGVPVLMDLIRIESRGEDGVQGEIKILSEPSLDWTEHNVIILEDLVHTGKTLNKADTYFKGRNPKSINYAVILEKKNHEALNFNLKYTVLKNVDEKKWVVGYGMDDNQKYRGLYFICSKIAKPLI